jgi:hypothetical protein
MAGGEYVAEIHDALNYPYIRVRDVDWLKSTLLLFPHVARIRPYDGPEDDPEIDVFAHTIGARNEALLRSIYPHDIPHHLQEDLLDHLRAALSRDGKALRRRFGKSATQRELEGRGLGGGVWARRMRGTTQVHNEKVAPQLLHELRENGLAWEPDQSDHWNYVEMHRVIGDAVMSSLAFAAAQARGMRLVTEFPDLYAQTIKRPIGEIFSGVTARPARERPSLPSRKGELVAEAVIFRHCDLSRLDAGSLAMLSKEHEALSDFRDSVEEFAKTIPTEMTDPKVISQHIADRAQCVVERWEATKRNSLPSFRRIFGQEAGKSFQDSLKEAFKDSVKASVPGVMFASVPVKQALICAGGGLAIGVAFRLFERTERQKGDAQGLRYLNTLQRHGVAISVSAA